MQMRVYMGRVVAILLTAMAVMTSCIVVDEYAPKQRTQIENYLTKNQLEYTITADSAYVHLAGNKYLGEEEVRGSGATAGDDVTFNFEAYTFSSSPATTPYYTNKQALAEQLTDLNTQYWDFEPRVATLGNGDILKPLEDALMGSVRGDSLAVFMTSSIAYGEGGMGSVPANTAVMMVLIVEDVTQ